MELFKKDFCGQCLNFSKKHTTALQCLPKNLKTWRDSNQGLLILRRMRSPVLRAASTRRMELTGREIKSRQGVGL
jgi:hypothetical protein